MLLSPRLVRVFFVSSLSNLLYFIFFPGTPSFGILNVPLPTGAILVSQILWGSIGWSVGESFGPLSFDKFSSKNIGSCLGAAFAAQDIGLPRVMLFIGDGSLWVIMTPTKLIWITNSNYSQLTVQELSPMIRKGLKPIIFILNNKGYTIERYIRGKDRYICSFRWCYRFSAEFLLENIMMFLIGSGLTFWTRWTTARNSKLLAILSTTKLNSATFLTMLRLLKPARYRLLKLSWRLLMPPRAWKGKSWWWRKVIHIATNSLYCTYKNHHLYLYVFRLLHLSW